MALVTCPCAFRPQARTKRRPKFRGAPHKMRLVTFPCAFRLRRFAQNVGLNYKTRHFSCKFSHKMAFVICPCAFRLRRLARSLRHGVLKLLVCGIFIVNSRVGLLWRSCYTFLLRGPFVILHMSFTEDLVEILVRSSVRGPCMKILQMPCLTGACMKAIVGGSWEALVSRSCKIHSSSSRSFDTILWASL